MKYLILYAILSINAFAAIPGQYPPDPLALSKVMHELDIEKFRESTRQSVFDQSADRIYKRAADFWDNVRKARRSGCGYD